MYCYKKRKLIIFYGFVFWEVIQLIRLKTKSFVSIYFKWKDWCQSQRQFIHTVFPRIVSAETILFLTFKTLKISYSFRIKFSIMWWKLVVSSLGCVNYSREETFRGNTVNRLSKKIIKTITFQQKPLPKEPIWAGIEGRLVPVLQCDVAPFLPPPKMLWKNHTQDSWRSTF